MSLILLGILNSQAAGGGALTNDFDHISTTTLTGSSATVNFTNLNTLTDYTHLQFRLSVISDWTGGASPWRINVTANGVGGSNYSWMNSQTTGASYQINSYDNSASLIRIGDVLLNSNTYGDHFGGVTLDIPNFRNTTTNKSFFINRGVADSISMSAGMDWGMFMQTSAISSIQFAPSTANFAVESNFSLYGWKG